MKAQIVSGYPLGYNHGDEKRDYVTAQLFVKPKWQGCACRNANGTVCTNLPLPGTQFCFVHSFSFCAPEPKKLLKEIVLYG